MMYDVKARDAADRVLAAALKIDGHVLTKDGVLCRTCAEGAEPENVLRAVALDSGEGVCYNCDEDSQRTGRECWCHKQ